MKPQPLLRRTSAGLYCELGGFHIDPWHPVARAVVTHAHADHFVPGCKSYLTARPGKRVLQQRLGPQSIVQPVEFGAVIDCFGVKVSLHPAGHILGSAQVRVEHQGEVWVVSGDYKVHPDRTCAPFEPIPCQTFVTESTFGHPYFAWTGQTELFQQIHDWWRNNQSQGHASWLYAYSLGKAQRLLAGLDPEVGPIYVHPQIAAINDLYREAGVELPVTRDAFELLTAPDWQRAVFILPPQERWQDNLTPLGPYRTAFVSGWMALPNGPRQRRVETGFALSDHADYGEIIATVRATGAERTLVTHGYIDVLCDKLAEQGLTAEPLRTPRCGTPPKVPAAQPELPF